MTDFRQSGDQADGAVAEREAALSPDRGAGRSRASRLIQTIEGEVIPRLMLQHRGLAPARCPAESLSRAGPAEVLELVRLILSGHAEAPSAYVSELLDGRLSIESAYLDLLAPAARHFGVLWEEDRADFVQVTLALRRLQEIAHELSPAFTSEAKPVESGRRILLVPVPGDQHTFGSVIVAEFMRRAGWDVWDDPGVSRDDIVEIVRNESFSVVGMSVTCDAQLDGLASLIRAIRRNSRNRSVGIMVGGRPFTEHPERVALVGADVTAADGRHAVTQAQHLLALLADRA